jgi:transposase-like protein
MNEKCKNGQFPGKQSNPMTELHPDPQVLARPTRRTFTAEYKRRILKEADACSHHGDLGELLRREGLYSSTLTSFRKQQQAGRLNGADPEVSRTQHKQKEAARQRDARRIARLESENQKLRALLELQKKLSDLIGVPLLTEPNE